MIKEITSALLLTAAITNTQITQTVQRQVYLDQVSYWTEKTTKNNDDEIILYEAYRNKHATNNISNQSFEIRQRTIEAYTWAEPPSPAVSNYSTDLLAVFNIKKTNNIDFIYYFDLESTGYLNNIYPTRQMIYREWVIENYDIDTNSTMSNFINNEQMEQYNEYILLTNEFYAETQNATLVEEQFLNEQNYSNFLNNKEIDYMGSSTTNEITIYVEISIQYARDGTYPNTEPYTPYGNYLTEMTYNVDFTSTINPSGQGEIVDIPGMMLMMLGMPFTFMAQAFNLTIFPGTMYEVNLAHIAIAIFGAAILLFIIKRFLK